MMNEIRNLAEAVARFHDEAAQWVADEARHAVADGTARWIVDPEVPGVWGLVRLTENGRETRDALAVVYSRGDWEEGFSEAEVR